MPMIALSQLPSRNAARLGADRWALRHGEDVLTWGELDEGSTRRAHALAAAGVRPNDLVMIALPNGNALFELSFALWKLGATPAMVSGSLPPAELKGLVDLAQPRLLIAQGAAAEARKDALGPDFGLDGPAAPLPDAPIARHWKVMTSGGSTGRPKLIVAKGPAEADPEAPALRLPSDAAILTPGPCHHNMPYAMSITAMARGSSVSGMVRFDPAEALRLIARDRVEWVTMVPTMMRRIHGLDPAERDGFDLSSLRTMLHTAAPTPAWLKRWWIEWLGPDRVWEVYGGTEGVGVTMIGGHEWLERPGSVGRAAGCEVRVLDAEGRTLPPGETGEIFFFPLAGQETPFHYVGADIRRSTSGGVSLGDRGQLDEAGYLHVTGRATDLILCGGENVYPAEIEDVLSAVPGVGAVVVIGLPDEDLGERIHAIIEPLDPAAPPSEAALRTAAQTALERRKWPRTYEYVPGPLRDAAGKVRRSTLREARV